MVGIFHGYVSHNQMVMRILQDLHTRNVSWSSISKKSFRTSTSSGHLQESSCKDLLEIGPARMSPGSPLDLLRTFFWIIQGLPSCTGFHQDIHQIIRVDKTLVKIFRKWDLTSSPLNILNSGIEGPSWELISHARIFEMQPKWAPRHEETLRHTQRDERVVPAISE